MQTVHEQFFDTADLLQGKPLFQRPGKAAISFAQMRELVERMAGALTELEVGKGDRVAVQIEKSPEAIALYLATLHVGGIFLPLNTAYTTAEIDYFVGDAAPRVFVCDPARLHENLGRATADLRVETLGAEGDGTLMERAAAATPREDGTKLGPDDRAAILYTSGTTGRSKGAVLTHRNLASNTMALLDCWQFTADDRLIHALPIFHTHGLFVAANMALVSGATMIFLTKFDAEEAITLMENATVLMGVPTFYTRLLKSPRLSQETTSNMRLFVSGSAPLLAEDHRAFETRTGKAILERYGMTETCMIASNPYDGARIPGAVGMALPEISIRICDRETGAQLPAGEVGLIEVKGPNVFEGYWNMPEKTAAEFRKDGYFITGDLGRVDEDGYFFITDRLKRMINASGFKVWPAEVEALMFRHPAIQEACIIAAKDSYRGETVKAVVVLRATHQDTTEQQIIDWCRENMAVYKVPRIVQFVAALPKSGSGKVMWRALQEQEAQ